MADETLLVMDVGSTTEEFPPSVNNDATRNYKGYLSKPYAEYAPSQQLKIELYRMKFLKDCKACKRPPPSLRIRGASAMNNEVKLKLFSQWESELLNEAIKDKQKLVNRLRKRVQQEDIPLSSSDLEKISHHFGKKFEFYMHQNKT